MNSSLKLSQRLFYFTFIGAAAAGVHILTVLSLVTSVQLLPIIANVFAFLIAFNVSFFGHRVLTFARLDQQKKLSFPHFFMVASSAGVINEVLYFLLLEYTNLNYLIALSFVLVLVSIYSFLLSRFWACR